MSNVIVDKNKIDILANAISNKSGKPVTMTLAEMVEAVDGIETGGGTPTLETVTKTYTPSTTAVTDTITPSSGYDGIEEVDVTVSAVPYATGSCELNDGYSTVSSLRKFTVEADGYATGAGWVDIGYVPAFHGYKTYNAIAKNTSVTPTESSQTIGGADYMMEGAVTVNAIPSNYVGSSITRRSSADLTASTLTVTAPSGYYASNATKTLTDANLTAENIKKDVQIFGVTGSYEGGGGGTPMSIGMKTATLSSAASSISFSSLSGEPTSFVVTSSTDQSTGGTKVVAVVYDGTSCHGMDITTQAADDTGFTQSYSNGTLTITATTASFQANEYKLVYSYNGSAANVHTADVQVGSGATSITFTDLEDEPEYFSCIFKSTFSTSSGYQRVVEVVYDGTNTYGHALDSSAKALTSWSYTYNNGSLTISSTGTNNGGYFHQPGYYQLTYVIDGDQSLQTKTVTPTTSTQNVTADEGYEGLKKVVVNPIPSQYIVPTGNIAITQNTTGQNTIDVSQYATATVNVPTGGGSANIATATMTNSSNQNTSISFTIPSGRTVKAFFCRLTSQIARNSSSRYYYVFDMRWDGSSSGGVAGNQFYMYNGTLSDVTSGYSHAQSGTTFTLSSTGSRSASPGSFFNGTYELVYVY